MDKWWIFLLDATSWINLIFIVFILFFERKEPGRRLGWLLALVFLPIIGMILYVLLSGHFFTRTRKMNAITYILNKKTQPILNEQLEYYTINRPTFKNSVLRDYDDLITMNLINSSSPISFTKSINVYTNGYDMFENLCADMEKAKKSIYMQFFIFHKDKIGSRIMDILCRKAAEGVDVRLLYDDFGSLKTPTHFFKQLNNAGGATASFFPIRIGAPFSVNFRNHRKNVIIDETIGYMGGLNVGDEYIEGLFKKHDIPWRDTHIRMTGSCVPSMLRIFLIDWFSCAYGKKALKHPEDVDKNYPVEEFEKLNRNILNELKRDKPGDSRIPTQIVSSGPNDVFKSEIRDLMIRMIMDAKKSIYIQTPYFTPDEAFFSALKIAGLSGKDIRIIVPGKWDKPYVRAAAFEYIREMIPYGVKFFAYSGFIHAKVLIIDNKIITIGTTNIDTRSFELHFEMNAIFYDEPFAKKYNEIFLNDQVNSTLMSKEWLDTRFIFRRALWSFCKLFSPLM